MNQSDSSSAIPTAMQSFLPEMIAIRHDLHQHPELSFEEHRTSKLISELLARWGFEVTTGIAKTGLVGRLKRGNSTKSIGLRADMDALPIFEQANVPYKSVNPGVMHACGHDGHMAILLTTARYLSQAGNFDGTLNLIFQPAEENYGGAEAMIQEKLFERFPCDAIFGLHNVPGQASGTLGFFPNAFMASFDNADITIKGYGGHGAMPHSTSDPIVAASAIVMALQTIVARNVNPHETAVISVGSIHGGEANNVIPNEVVIRLTVRAFNPEVRKLLKQRIYDLAQAQAKSFNASVEIDYQQGYPVVVNDPAMTAYAHRVAQQNFPSSRIIENMQRIGGSEDFSYFLQKVPGSFLIIGNGDSESLHHDQYVFDDQSIGIGAAYWAYLVEHFLSSQSAVLDQKSTEEEAVFTFNR